MSSTKPIYRIPTLDGLRAISIAMVWWGHLSGTPGVNFGMSFASQIANTGVRVFFVISGFLITSLLLNEQERTSRISLKDFYLRRIFRIFPAFYFYIAVAVLLVVLGRVAVKPGDLLFAVTYLSNFHHDHAWYVGHLWSLSVEEQFYLLWPAVVAFSSRKTAIRVAVAVMLTAPLFRLYFYYGTQVAHEGVGKIFPTIADALAAGCLLAYFQTELAQNARYQRFKASPLFAVVPLVVVAALFTFDHPMVNFAVGQTAMNIAIAMCIDWTISRPNNALGRLLETRPFVFVGVLSYSLYLWQQPFLNRYMHSVFTQAPLNLICAFAAACFSYYLIEKPFLKLKKRFAADSVIVLKSQAVTAD